MPLSWFRSDALSARIAQWFLSLALTVAIIIAAIAVALQVVSWGYTELHPIALHEEDLGYGLVMMLTPCISLLAAVPVGGFLVWRLRKFISDKVNEKNDS